MRGELPGCRSLLTMAIARIDGEQAPQQARTHPGGRAGGELSTGSGRLHPSGADSSYLGRQGSTDDNGESWCCPLAMGSQDFGQRGEAMTLAEF